MNIGIDIDGVLACFEAAYAPLLTERCGIVFPVGQPGFPAVWAWDKEAGVPKAVINSAWEHVKTTNFWRTLPPTAECRAAMQYLTVNRFAGDNIYFITTRPGASAKYLTEEWLKDQGFSMPTVLIAGGEKEKGTLARGLHLDVFLDDKPSNCEEVHRATLGACKCSLLDQPYNQDDCNSFSTRVFGVMAWLESLNTIEWRMPRAA